MFRKRLKVTTGCSSVGSIMCFQSAVETQQNSNVESFQCRQRRKKCDENRPVCQSCQRLGFSCFWPDGPMETRQRARITQSSIIQRLPATTIRSLSSGYLPIEDQTQFTLTTRAVPILLPFLRRPGKDEVWDISLVTTCALRQGRLRYSLCAFAAIFYSGVRLELKQKALIYYNQGCAALRRSITFSSGTSHLDDPSDAMASTFLGLCEVSLCMQALESSDSNMSQTSLSGRPRSALTHFTAAAKMLSQACWIGRDAQSTAVARFLAELILYWTSSLCFLDSRLDEELRCLNTNWYDKLLQPLPKSKIVHHELSPFFVGTYDFLLLALRITLFGRTNCTEDMRQLSVNKWSERLSELQLGRFETLQGLPEKVANFISQLCTLYTRVLQILLLKVQTPRMCSSSPVVQEKVRSALATLLKMRCINRSIRIPPWPLFILYCAVEDPVQLLILDESLAFTAPSLPDDYSRWRFRVVEQIKTVRGLNEELYHKDGLGLLVRDGGILGSLDFELWTREHTSWYSELRWLNFHVAKLDSGVSFDPFWTSDKHAKD